MHIQEPVREADEHREGGRIFAHEMRSTDAKQRLGAGEEANTPDNRGVAPRRLAPAQAATGDGETTRARSHAGGQQMDG